MIREGEDSGLRMCKPRICLIRICLIGSTETIFSSLPHHAALFVSDWVMVVPGLVVAVVTGVAIAIVHRLRRRQEGADAEKQTRQNETRDGTRTRSREAGRETGRDGTRAHDKKKKHRSKTKANTELNRSQSVPNDRGQATTGRENISDRQASPGRLNQSEPVYTLPDPATREPIGGSVYEHVALQPMSSEDNSGYERPGLAEQTAHVYATLGPDDTYTKLDHAGQRKQEKRKKSRKREENTYVRVSKKRK